MNTILKYYLRAVVLLFPIVFIPVLTDAFGFGKNISLMAMVLVALILWIMKLILGKEKVVKTNKLFWLFLVFVVWSGVTFFRLDAGSKMMSLMLPAGMGTELSLLVLFFVWLQTNDEKENEKQFLFLTISGLIVGVVSLIVFMIPNSKLPLSIPKENPFLSINANWSLTGSILNEAIFLLFIVMGWLKKLVAKIKEKAETMTYITEAVASAFFSLLIFLDVYKIVKAGWAVLDRTSSWVIAVETFKRSPIFGVGIGNFVKAFDVYRPISFNLTKYWTSVFSFSSMGVLQIWTELGIVGLLMVIYLVMVILKLKKNFKFWQVMLFLAVVLFLPLNLMSVFLLIWLMSVGIVGNKESKLILNVGEKNLNIMPYIVAVLILVGSVFSGYWMGRMFLGDFYIRKAMLMAAKNDGSGTYNFEIKAIGINPNLASYRKIYSQTNLALAQALLGNKEIGDSDKQQASVLVQQAVREAKVAISLDQKNPEYWYNLAGIYRSLVGLVDGVADWSYQAYQQALVLDPINPALSLDMGGLFYAAGNYEQADRAFEQSVTNKNDYANGWYNWAYSAKKLNKVDVAVTRLEQALKLVPADSGDYEAAAKELNTWKKELEQLIQKQQEYLKQQQAQQTAEQKQPETLKTAEPLPTVGEEEKVNVPAEQMQPPVAPSPIPTTAP